MSGPDDLAAVVFDLDGTLANSHTLIARTVNRVLAERGYPSVEPSRVHAMTGLPLLEIFEAMLPPAAREEAPGCVVRYRERFDAEVLPDLRPIDGARETVLWTATLGPPLAVATGRLTSTARTMLHSFGLLDQFRVVLGVDGVPRPKPYPDLLLAVLRLLGGLPAASVLVVGDATADVQMAHEAGAAVCAVTWGAQPREMLERAEPEWCVDSWGAVREVIGSFRADRRVGPRAPGRDAPAVGRVPAAPDERG